MRIDMTELFSVDGKEKDYSVGLDMTVFKAPDGSYAVSRKEPVSLHIRHMGSRKLSVHAQTSLSLLIPCSRCLELVEVPFSLTMDEEADYAKSSDEEDRELSWQPYKSGNHLDTDRLVGNELLLNLPMKVLCKEDCKGLCSRCGMNLNHGRCFCDQRSSDPRMSVIQDLYQQMKEV